MSLRLPMVSIVVGIRKEWQRIKLYNACKAGDKVWLVRDPRNIHDKNAIEVHLTPPGGHVGFIPAELAAKMVAKGGDWSMGEGVIVLRGVDYDRKLNNKYCLNIKIERLD